MTRAACRRVRRYLIDRAVEPSTWRGVVLIATAAGASLTDTQREAIITVGIGLAGVIAAAIPDRRREPPGDGQ